jgi:DNA mismatch endonuclease (patch repair protein)
MGGHLTPRGSVDFPDVPPAIRARMAKIRKRDTKPELVVRRCAHRLGYRFRLHRADLPGTPDLVFPALRKVIFVNGCFWHQHTCRLGRKAPRTRQEYWLPKLTRNVARDHLVHAELRQRGWSALVVWECETRDHEALAPRLHTFLGDRLQMERSIRQTEVIGASSDSTEKPQ